MTGRRTATALPGLALVAALAAGCAAPGTTSHAPATPPAANAPAKAASPQTPTAPPAPTPTQSAAATDTATPTRVIIPAIGVNSSLVDLHLNTAGVLVPPTSYTVAGWYAAGPAPGQPGPAVIAGHIDSTSGPAVFYRLSDLRAGDEVDVDLSDGTVARFTVNAVQQYSKGAFPTAAVYGPVPGSALRLITCGGSFDYSVHSYRDNTVVYATEM